MNVLAAPADGHTGPVQDRWLTIAQIKAGLQVDEATVRRWLKAGLLPGVNFGGKAGWRVREADLAEFLERRRHRGPSSP